jgi:CelD/BcsL family acetyltransferase involved in cellulose biosynthesis
MAMEFLCIDPQSDPLWQRLIERYESSTFHSPNWIRVLTGTYGFPAQAYVITDEAGEPVAGLPFCRVEDIRGKRLVALPFSDYCDPLVGEAAHWRLLLDTLFLNENVQTEQVSIQFEAISCN